VGNMTKETIKSNLISLLNNPEIDYSEILRLSNELSKLDEDYVRFSIDAAHISRLGKELVSRQETAVAELVKNAYDADSTSVELVYENTDSVGGRLTITDEGNGMSREELINGFMRISTSDKRHNPKSEKYKRTRAGQKGIGRFAAQRLGNKLKIITQRENASSALEVNIDWKKFESDSDLLLIANKVNLVPKTSKKGTKLVIEDLCDAWSEAQIRRVYRYIIELIQPVPLSDDAASSNSDPGFKVLCQKKSIGEEPLIIADDQTMVFDHALAEIRGYVDEKGTPNWSVKSKHLGLNDESSFKPGEYADKYLDLKGVSFQAYYFIYSNEYIPRQLKAKLTKLGNEKGGIRVYRNGFRVRPYGEAYNDWLRLDYSASLRQILPPHSNQNFFGFVELHDPEGLKFEETASREPYVPA
jgi:HSP90 family molecular chaperone